MSHNPTFSSRENYWKNKRAKKVAESKGNKAESVVSYRRWVR